MSKRRVRRKRRARVNIKPLILAGVIIAGVITVVMSVNLKGADKEPPTEEIYITETPQAENTEPVTETEQEAKLEHDFNYTYPYNTMSADWGAEVYEEGFRYYEIPQEYKDAGGCFPEIVQVYLWCECKEYGVDYYTVLALIERESGYHWDKVGDNGNSKGYMQIYEKWHTERMEVEGVTDLFNPYQNIRVGLNCLREITALRKSVATVKGTGLYSGITAEVHLRYIEKAMRGGGSVGSDCKKYSKRSITKAEL